MISESKKIEVTDEGTLFWLNRAGQFRLDHYGYLVVGHAYIGGGDTATQTYDANNLRELALALIDTANILDQNKINACANPLLTTNKMEGVETEIPTKVLKTKSQENVLIILGALAGFVASSTITKLGGYCASLPLLIRCGFVEKMEAQTKAFPVTLWRITEDGRNQLRAISSDFEISLKSA